MTWLEILPKYSFLGFIVNWLSKDTLCRLDTSLCNVNFRQKFLDTVCSYNFLFGGDDVILLQRFNFLFWIAKRRLSLSIISLQREWEDAVLSSYNGIELKLNRENSLVDSLTEMVSKVFILSFEYFGIYLDHATDPQPRTPINNVVMFRHLLRSLLNDKLLHLNLSGCGALNDTFLANSSLLPTCTLLHTLNLSGCDLLLDTTFAQISLMCPNLTHLNVSDCFGLTTAGLKPILISCDKLAIIDVSRCRGLNDEGHSAIFSHCNKRLLELYSDGNELSTALFHVVMCCPLLRHLSLDHHVITTSTDTSISDESKAVSLTFLSLSNCSTLSDSALDAILCMCSGVEHLNVAGCPLLTAAVLPSLSKCTSLTSIHFSDSSFSISSICQPFVFFQCIALRHLFLSNISPSMQQATARWFSSTVAPSSTLRSILTLDISSCTDLHDTTLLGVARLCPLLTDLDVSHCHRVTDFSIKAVAAACTALTRIDISQCALITDVSLISLANHCHELLILRVAFCRHITDISLIEASIGCPLLRDLDVDHCDLLSEEGLATFVGNNWGHLRRFSLRCVRNHLTETDDCALNEIGQQCSRLEALSISGRGFKLGGFIADMVANCLALRELRVVFVKELCDADVLRMVSSCRHLISFSLEHCSRITDVGATYVLRNCLLLRSLCVKGSAISVATLDALATGVCPSLRFFDVTHCVSVSDSLVKSLMRGRQSLVVRSTPDVSF